MKDKIKKLARKILIGLRIPATKNIEYDIYTGKILKTILQPYSNCVDVGAHKGEILDLFLQLAPKGRHVAFEPIPDLYTDLLKKYGSTVEVYPYALSNKTGSTSFNLVIDDPAYSGLQKRKYKKENAMIEQIVVEVRTLDDVLANRNAKIDLIKIDVEGGEFDVLKGAEKILSEEKPDIIFECGKGASEFYGTKPQEIFQYLNALGYSVFTLHNFLHPKNGALNLVDFCLAFNTGKEYYFIAIADSVF